MAIDTTDSSDGVTIYYEPSGCNCNNKATYQRSAIHAACVQALSLASQGETVGRDKYPHAYNDEEHFKFKHASRPFFEFPIMEDGSVYTGSTSPGADRIVIGSIADDYSSAVFCATITHTGASRYDGFVECKDDTVNRDGQGSWDTRKPWGMGLEPKEGRHLLQPENVKLPWWDESSSSSSASEEEEERERERERERKKEKEEREKHHHDHHDRHNHNHSGHRTYYNGDNRS